LLEHYGIWYQPERKGLRGRFLQSIKIALPRLQYAVVVKQRQRGRVVKVEQRIAFGTQQIIDLLL
jgi:hypothetical protein